MNLNVGSGSPKGIYRRKEWINVDIRHIKGVNVYGSLFQLPFKENTFSEIHCVHVLEHLTRDKTIPALKEIRRVLNPSGFALIEVPDFEGIVKQLANFYISEVDPERIRLKKVALHGKSDIEGQAHYWGFDRHDLACKVKEAGFSNHFYETKMISRHCKHDPVLLIHVEK